jgi:transketolase
MTDTNPRELANAIRFLSIDAVQKANSGHPGMPMGMADIAEVLWREFMCHNPSNPNWHNRDRFILSNGHGSMLQYSVLHLTGYDLTIDDLKQFRQLNSKTPGHPEYGHTPGVETTTGPLGQGLASAVGMALAEKILAAQFNQPEHEIIDHHTYVFAGDGCLMEGISHEACSLAGYFGLGKLIVFYDDNNISIDGCVKNWFTDDTPKRFEAYGWHVIKNVDGHNRAAILQATAEAKTVKDRPTLICCKTVIGYGAPKLNNSCKAHGSPLGAEEIAATRKALNWNHEPFVIPTEIYQAWDAKQKGKELEQAWLAKFAVYKKAYPELAAELERRLNKKLPNNWQKISTNYLQQKLAKQDSIATRKASQNALNAYAPILPELIGGSADLTESNLTDWIGCKDLTNQDFTGNYLHYGVREFGMCALMSGIANHGGFIPYGGTFLIFSDYARNAIRLAALMHIHVIYVLSHDSIGLGEDGPTHQPIEQLASLRLIPNLSLWRPGDELETAVAWKHAIENKNQPTCIILTRQKVAAQEHHTSTNIERGGYILLDCKDVPEVILIATGSEVELAIEAAKQLNQQGLKIRVVSMPSTDVFDKQDANYRESVLPSKVTKRIAIEAGSTVSWYKYVGLEGKVVGIDEFGKSAPAQQLFAVFGITVQNIVQIILNF